MAWIVKAKNGCNTDFKTLNFCSFDFHLDWLEADQSCRAFHLGFLGEWGGGSHRKFKHFGLHGKIGLIPETNLMTLWKIPASFFLNMIWVL